MTEAGWLTSNDPTSLLQFLQDRGAASDRKLRLFAVACCRRIRQLLRPEWGEGVLDAAERFADGLMTAPSLRDRRRIPGTTPEQLAHPPSLAVAAATHDMLLDPNQAAGFAADSVADTEAPMGMWQAVRAGEQAAQADLVRCIFHNPFRPVVFDPTWRTSSVLSLACSMYASRDFAAMAVLADALEDGGCHDDAILAHCRGHGPRVRGDWAVDLVLGKS